MKKHWISLVLISLILLYLELTQIDFILSFLQQWWGYIKKILIPFTSVIFLIAFLEPWISDDKVKNAMGKSAGAKAYFWAILLACTTLGSLMTAFPLAQSLHRKGASLSVILCFIGASGVCRIPMTIFEISYLGWTFTLLRLLVTLPLIVLSSHWIGIIHENRNYPIKEEESM